MRARRVRSDDGRPAVDQNMSRIKRRRSGYHLPILVKSVCVRHPAGHLRVSHWKICEGCGFHQASAGRDIYLLFCLMSDFRGYNFSLDVRNMLTG